MDGWIENPTPELWNGISLEAQKMVLPSLTLLLGNLAKDNPVVASVANCQFVQKITK